MFSDQQLSSASLWTYLTKREKADRLYHYTNIPVKDYLTGLVASILGKIFRTSTTKRLKKINPNRIHLLRLQLVSILFERLRKSSESRNWYIHTYMKYVFNLLWKKKYMYIFFFHNRLNIFHKAFFAKQVLIRIIDVLMADNI